MKCESMDSIYSGCVIGTFGFWTLSVLAITLLLLLVSYSMKPYKIAVSPAKHLLLPHCAYRNICCIILIPHMRGLMSWLRDTIHQLRRTAEYLWTLAVACPHKT